MTEGSAETLLDNVGTSTSRACTVNFIRMMDCVCKQHRAESTDKLVHEAYKLPKALTVPGPTTGAPAQLCNGCKQAYNFFYNCISISLVKAVLVWAAVHQRSVQISQGVRFAC